MVPYTTIGQFLGALQEDLIWAKCAQEYILVLYLEDLSSGSWGLGLLLGKGISYILEALRPSLQVCRHRTVIPEPHKSCYTVYTLLMHSDLVAFAKGLAESHQVILDPSFGSAYTKSVLCPTLRKDVDCAAKPANFLHACPGRCN